MKQLLVLGLGLLFAAGALAQPSLRVTPQEVDYGEVTVGESAQVMITLENVGDELLFFNDIRSDTPEFESLVEIVEPGVVGLGFGGVIIEFGVIFTPSAEGDFSGTLTIESDDPMNPAVTVALSGSGASDGGGDFPGDVVALPRPVSVVTSFDVMRNYPNPFNPSTNIQFDLAEAGAVQLKVYDALGREVETLVHGTRGAGSHTVTWNASDRPSGVYFYTLEAGGLHITRKMLLTK